MKLILGVGLLSILSSCSALMPGHETFRCQGTDKGGICAPVDYIYTNREDIANGFNFSLVSGKTDKGKKISKDIVLIKKETVEQDCKYFGDRCYLGEERSKIVKERKIPVISLPLPSLKKEKYRKFPIPVREEALIQRVLIFPYETKKGNLVQKHFIYVVIRNGRWLSPSGEYIKKLEVEE